MGLAESIKRLKQFRLRNVREALEFYDWETAGILVLCTLFFIFGSLLSFRFSFLALGYFWCWTLVSPKLVHKGLNENPRFSLLRTIMVYETNFRKLPFIKFLEKKGFCPMSSSRVFSVTFLGLIMSLVTTEHYWQYYLLGALCFEGVLLVRALYRES